MSTASTLKVQGSISADPPSGSPSGIFGTVAPISIQASMVRKHEDEVDLDSNGAVTVGFGGVTNAGFVFLKVTGGKVKVSLATADDDDAVVPVDDHFMLQCRKTPVTGITLTREAGVPTSVSIFLGEFA